MGFLQVTRTIRFRYRFAIPDWEHQYRGLTWRLFLQSHFACRVQQVGPGADGSIVVLVGERVALQRRVLT